ncbi:MAG: peptide ABC transporter substrate-binding protein [Chloroflexota bacterium]
MNQPKKFGSLYLVTGLLLVLVMALAACAAPASDAPAADTGAADADSGEEAADDSDDGGDVLTILYWQAASLANPYLSGGTKDIDASTLVLEPLANFDENGLLVPTLAQEIPTLDNGGVSEDLTQITWTLKEGVMWSDGTPLTTEDVVFTYEYCTNEATGCGSLTNYQNIVSVEAVDDLTVVITFDAPKPYPYEAFVSQLAPVIQKAQFADCAGEAAQTCTDANLAPIGTGPYVVVDFKVNDVVVYEPNANYRDGAPAFSQVIFKGGGDAASAARAVLETGEADYAWNLQVEPQILNEMAEAGMGELMAAFATNVERLMINQTNPDPALGDDRSEYMDGENPHPFLTDHDVVAALSMAIDRNVIAEQLYGAAGNATCNVLPGPPKYASSNNDGCLTQDIDGANALLDEAGIVDTDGDGIREKDGTPLVILYQTSTNGVRQKTQALIKQWWAEIGVDTELRDIDASVFFGGDPNSPDTYGKFYADIEMYTNGSSGIDPQIYLDSWQCSEINGAVNNWLGNNVPRWCNPDYDALYAELTATAGEDARAAIAIELNDMLVQNYAMVPLVHRGSASARANSLSGVRMNAWDSEMWNIEDWSRE